MPLLPLVPRADISLIESPKIARTSCLTISLGLSLYPLAIDNFSLRFMYTPEPGVNSTWKFKKKD